MSNISIIIPLYNGSLLVKRCLDSIYNQKGSFELEVIVIDDGSTDNSVDIVKNYSQPIILLQQTNSGPAAARNKGIKAATGKYLAFLDADDYWEAEFLLETIGFLEKQEDAIAVSVGQIHKIPNKPDSITPSILKTEPTKYKQATLLKDFYNFWAKHMHVCTGSVLMRTEIVRHTGGQRPELRITEDLEFWAYLATFGKWGFIPKILFISDGGAVTKKTGWLEKNQKRWASAPSVEDWEKRIIRTIPDDLIESFSKARGIIAKNLTYSMILSKRKSLARETVRKYGKYFPSDQLSKWIKGASKISFLWHGIIILITQRETHRKL
jgi:glycosyltransferase involved in cell wall biosynthesis